jgi:hypothetical protein
MVVAEVRAAVRKLVELLAVRAVAAMAETQTAVQLQAVVLIQVAEAAAAERGQEVLAHLAVLES